MCLVGVMLLTVPGALAPDLLLSAFLTNPATLPVIGAGFALDHYYPNGLRSLEIIAWATLVFGIALWSTHNFF